MSESILDRLYYGRIVPWENQNDVTPQMQEVKSRIDAAFRSLTEQLSNEGIHLLETLMSDRSDLESLALCEAFKDGFRLGAEFALDTFPCSKQV